ncbi:MAG: hypothetical protein QN141_02270 [Armatimonadota bacterium]|nr:hypothetical protein [Armatimonadota bacterium]MDR7450726.1 hypothetical protein [Armatimonadota bacterium]MDR7466082.1 hypothetical protein [Armatimonadota bacterium]MDR7493881.1 hypothetical protein [Armatimonadota bacterium]MDR7498958.1 hypothetical protein [Armatimonadota bacterium]
MSSHFSAVGFPVRSMDEYWALARRAASSGVRDLAADGSALVRWTVDSGPEIWSTVNRAGEVTGAVPFFATGQRHKIAVTGTGEDPDDELAGWIDGWIEPTEDDEPYSGAFPLRVDLVNYAVTRTRLVRFPSVHAVELAALAHEADLYPDPQAYVNAPGEVYRVPLGSFVSSAHFAADEEVASFTEATGMLSAPIDWARLLTNPATGAPYWWMQVTIQGVRLHAFADRETLGGEPAAGRVLAGSFWMLGRLL